MMQELKYVGDRHVVEFKEYMILKNFSKRTVKTYTQIVYQFLNWWSHLEGEMPMNDDIVRKYLLMRFEEGKDWSRLEIPTR